MKTAEEVDDQGRPFVLASIATALFETGNIAAAKKTLETAIKSAHETDGTSGKSRIIMSMLHALLGVAMAEAKAGDIDGALQTLEKIKDVSKDLSFALLEIAIAEAKAGNKQSAQQTLRQAFQMAQATHFLPRFVCLVCFIGGRLPNDVVFSQRLPADTLHDLLTFVRLSSSCSVRYVFNSYSLRLKNSRPLWPPIFCRTSSSIPGPSTTLLCCPRCR